MFIYLQMTKTKMQIRITVKLLKTDLVLNPLVWVQSRMFLNDWMNKFLFVHRLVTTLAQELNVEIFKY